MRPQWLLQGLSRGCSKAHPEALVRPCEALIVPLPGPCEAPTRPLQGPWGRFKALCPLSAEGRRPPLGHLGAS